MVTLITRPCLICLRKKKNLRRMELFQTQVKQYLTGRTVTVMVIVLQVALIMMKTAFLCLSVMTTMMNLIHGAVITKDKATRLFKQEDYIIIINGMMINN